MTFTKFEVHLVDGYPQQSDSDLLLAVYVNIPAGVTSQRTAIKKEVLTKIIDALLDDINSTIGKEVIFTQPRPRVDEEDNSTTLTIIIVVCIVVVLLVVISVTW